MYRYPENDAAALGRPPSAGLEQIAGLDEGTFERKSDDGVYRLFAFKRLRLTESLPPYLLITAGVPKDKILGKANFAMACDLLILGLAAAIAASLVWFLGNVAFTRPINRLVSAAQRFGSGEMDARTGLSHTQQYVMARLVLLGTATAGRKGHVRQVARKAWKPAQEHQKERSRVTKTLISLLAIFHRGKRNRTI